MSDNGLSGIFSLSATSVLLCLSLVTQYGSTLRFFNDDATPLTPEQQDTIDAWITKAIGELMDDIT